MTHVLTLYKFYLVICVLLYLTVKLRNLIDVATSEGILFVYAISPGLDITFSSAADVTSLKRKMKQVSLLIDNDI